MKYGDRRQAAISIICGLAGLFAIVLQAVPCSAARGSYELPDPTYAPPANYFNAATGTGDVLKASLKTIVSTGFVGRTYGDARYAFAVLDQDPNNPNNIILVYNGASVSNVWDAGATFAREHCIPVSWLGTGDPSNSYSGIESDLFELRPINPGVNSSRSNTAYGTPTSSGANGNTGGFYYPGDADAGMLARQYFYMATRYSDGTQNWSMSNIHLIDGTPGNASFAAGDLASVLKWNYSHGVDNFERRRNQYIYSSALNPTYYQGNRNPFVDHPEYVWAIFGGGNNNSQMYVGSSPNADGSSSATVSLGRIMLGGMLTNANVTMNKTGVDPTTFDITASGDGACAQAGVGQSIDYNTQSQTLSVGLASSVASTTGLKSGTVSIRNTDLTSGGAGQGSADGNDSINITASVLTQRLVTASSDRFNFNRVMVGSPISSSITLSTTGDDNNRTRVNVAGTVAADGYGIGISGVDTLFNSASTTAGRTIGGSFSSPGIKSGRLAMSVATAENGGTGLAGEAPYVNLYAWYSATALVNRVVTSTTTDLGQVHVGAVVSAPITLSTASGDDNLATRVRIGNAAPDANGIGVSGGSNPLFNDNAITDSRTVGGTASVAGPFSGTIALTAVGENLAGEAPQNVAVNYTAQVYSGQAIANSASGGSWASPSTWKDAVTASTAAPGPGIAGYAGDTATLGNAAGNAIATVTLDGVAPHLSSLTFSDTAGGYTIAAGSAAKFQHFDVGVRGPLSAGPGGALTLGTGAGADIHTTGGSNLIDVPLLLDDNLTLDGPGSLTISANISGSRRSLTKDGTGLLVLSGENSYDGGTFVKGGILELDGSGALPDGSSLSVGAGATLIFAADASYHAPSVAVAAVPEPGAGSLLAAAALGLVVVVCNRRQRRAICRSVS